MKIYSKIFCLFLFILIPHISQTQTASVPGFYRTGGGANIVHFFAKDSIHRDKIQLKNQEIKILLYEGFAVIKADYWMHNLSSQNIELKMALPFNVYYGQREINSVHYENIDKLKVLVDNKLVKTQKQEQGEALTTQFKFMDIQSDWYYWDMNFPAQKNNKITLYYLVNTHEGFLQKGYGSDKDNGFSFLGETGKIWAKNLERTSIYIKLMEDLQWKDIIGIYPFGTFKTDSKTQMIYQTQDIEPDYKHNILIRYQRNQESINFEKIQKNVQQYYQILDKINLEEINTKSFKKALAKDFKVRSWWAGNTAFLMMMLLTFGMPLMIIILGVVFIRHLAKKKKQDKK